MAGISTRSAIARSAHRSRSGIRALNTNRSEPWKRRKTSTERGNVATARADSATSAVAISA
jgi:hypothetical protein